MRQRHDDPVAYPDLYQLRITDKGLYFPNIFITLAPSEDKIPLHAALFGRYDANAK